GGNLSAKRLTGEKECSRGIRRGERTRSVALLVVDGSVLSGAGQQLTEDFVVHGQQAAVAFVALPTLQGNLAQLLPLTSQGVTARRRIGGQQARHAAGIGGQAEGGENLAAACVALGNGGQPGIEPLIQRFDTGAVMGQQSLVQLVQQREHLGKR